MIRNYLKVALRNLLKNKVYTFINIFGLAVGMAVAILIGLWIWDELSFNKYHKNYDRVAQVMLNQTFNGSTGSSRAVSLPLRGEIQNKYAADFKHIAQASWNFDHVLANGETKLIKSGMYAEPDLPEMLSLRMLKGSYQTALREPSSIILSESVAKALFGDEEALNKIIKVDNKADLKVTGIFEDLPFNNDFHETYFYMPWAAYEADQEWVKNSKQQWGNHSFQLYAQINDKADFDKVTAKIKDLEKPHSTPQENPEYFLHPMSKWHLYSDFKEGKNIGGRITFVWLFGIIGIFVLALACINFMNLSTARSEKRAKEVGVRKSIGSLREQLIFQFYSESFLVVFFAFLLSIIMVLLSLGWFNEVAGKEVRIPYANPVFWLLILLFTTITGFLSGSYPAIYLSSFNPLSVLKGTFRVGRWAAVPRKVLVVVQFTVSIVLIIGTIVVFNQINHAKNRPVGYTREGLIQTNINSELYGKYDVLRDGLLKSGAVAEMSVSSSPATGVWSNQIGFDWEGKDPNSLPLFGTVACTHDFGKTIGWNIIEGRDFSREYSTDTSALILNESAVALTGLKDIVGKTIRWNDTPYQVVGVVKNMVMESPFTPIKPTIFTMNYDWANIINIRLQPGVPVKEAISKVEAVFKIHSPNSPFDYKFTDEEYDAKFRAEERIGKLAGAFAGLAIFISCLGLFGLASFTAEQRTKEIGVRKVLGASVFTLWRLLSKDFTILVIFSFLIAAPITYYFMYNWLQTYEYRTDISWWVFILSGLGAMVITLLTVSYQSIRAAMINPVKSLKTE
ncbi:ABC transporter permease [Telluribacter humicola]|uniref:ABC transporter permease n=1 Tax=Telluribacter humicola TaxID=1720261 RepID=UPI001A969A2E|nr:ABC transporter permease [Telluribacter humicola]